MVSILYTLGTAVVVFLVTASAVDTFGVCLLESVSDFGIAAKVVRKEN